MTISSELTERAKRLHQAGRIADAEDLYQQVLRQQPDLPDVWLLLGDARLTLGKYTEAMAAYENALRLRPAAEAHLGLGNALAAAGRRTEAVTHYRQFVQARPEHAEARANLGVALAELGRLPEAEPELRAALRLKPDYPQAHHNLGVALVQSGRPEEAIASFEEALRLNPDYAEAYYNLGCVYSSQNQLNKAVASFREALAHRPNYADVYNNLGLALIDLRRSEEALVLLQHQVRLRGGVCPLSGRMRADPILSDIPPGLAEAHNNLGLVYADLGRFAEAEACYQEALRLQPGHVDAHSNLANAYKDQGRLAEAIASYDLALLYQPDAVSAHWNRSLALLQAGDFERGWVEYEWRWQRKQTPPRPLRQPIWDGSPLAGRTILLWMEQGLGDMIQFIRYAALVKERGGTVIVECPAFMIPLFSTCPAIDSLIAEGSPLSDFDFHAPLMSLPRLCNTTLATVPANVPYLFPKPDLVEEWRRQLLTERTTDFRIGIAWQGNPHHKADQHRSIPLVEFEPLARIPGIEVISLQKGPGTDQLPSHLQSSVVPGSSDPALAGRARVCPPITSPVEEPRGEIDANSGLPGRAAVRPIAEAGRFAPTVPALKVREIDKDAGAFMDTAAIMQHLDLVVTSDTAIAHLAGALGVRVWVALPMATDWRWLLHREDSPWYPSMRLFRQARWGSWKEVFQRITDELAKVSSRPTREDILAAELPQSSYMLAK